MQTLMCEMNSMNKISSTIILAGEKNISDIFQSNGWFFHFICSKLNLFLVQHVFVLILQKCAKKNKGEQGILSYFILYMVTFIRLLKKSGIR